MATIEQLVKQYETDKELQAEVAAIVADGKVTMMEFMTFAKKHDVSISIEDLPSISRKRRNSDSCNTHHSIVSNAAPPSSGSHRSVACSGAFVFRLSRIAKPAAPARLGRRFRLRGVCVESIKSLIKSAKIHRLPY
jgi:hypothetical protein